MLSAIAKELLRPDVISLYIEEYRAAAKEMLAELSSSEDTLKKRFAALERERSKLLSLFVSGKPEAGGAGYLRSEIDMRSDEMAEIRQRLDSANALTVPLDEAAIIADLREQIGCIREAMSEADPEAARAREIIRSLIDKITVHPIGLQRGRGAGMARLEIEGTICTLLGSTAEVDSRDGILSASVNQCRQYPIPSIWRITLLTGFDKTAQTQAISSSRLDTVYTEHPASTRRAKGAGRSR